jgi:hypothetical protein
MYISWLDWLYVAFERLLIICWYVLLIFIRYRLGQLRWDNFLNQLSIRLHILYTNLIQILFLSIRIKTAIIPFQRLTPTEVSAFSESLSRLHRLLLDYTISERLVLKVLLVISLTDWYWIESVEIRQLAAIRELRLIQRFCQSFVEFSLDLLPRVQGLSCTIIHL